MSYAAYKYLSDSGITYQVPLLTDFATALSYVAATGTEPFLPVWISPRYASYASSAGVWLEALVLPAPFNSTSPPTSLTVSGVTYSLQSTYGERSGVALPSNLVVVAGPPGQNGAAGATGATGAAGATGATGAAGATGATGAAGASGTSSPAFSSATQALTASHLFTLPHSLGRLPNFVQFFLQCETATDGYAAGELIAISPGSIYGVISTDPEGFSVSFDATNIYVTTSANPFVLQEKTAPGTAFYPTNAKFQWLARAW